MWEFLPAARVTGTRGLPLGSGGGGHALGLKALRLSRMLSPTQSTVSVVARVSVAWSGMMAGMTTGVGNAAANAALLDPGKFLIFRFLFAPLT
jgi:hypothetical protein